MYNSKWLIFIFQFPVFERLSWVMRNIYIKVENKKIKLLSDVKKTQVIENKGERISQNNEKRNWKH